MTQTPARTIDQQNHPLKGMGFMVLQTMFLALISVVVKYLNESGQHPVEISFWRSAIMILPMYLWIVFSGKLPLLKTANIKAQISRGAIGTITMLLMFITYTYLPLAEAQSLFYTAPLFIVLLSWPVLKEKVGPYRASATAVGFIGVLIMLHPESISSGIGAIFGLLSAFSMCLVTFLLRTLGRTQDPSVTIFYFAVVGVFVVAPFLPFFWKFPTPYEWALLGLVSALALVNQYALTLALFSAPPSITSPMSYIGLLWAILLDVTIWNIWPQSITMLGAAIVIAANIYILYREHKNARKS